MKKFHLALSVRGALNWSESEMKKQAENIIVDGEPLKTAQEVKDFLMDHLLKGHELLPCNDCDNFDYKKGCMGHEIEEGES